MEHVFRIEGMSCGGCVAAVEQALKAIKGVVAVQVDLAAKSARVDFDPASTTASALHDAVEEAGYEVIAE